MKALLTQHPATSTTAWQLPVIFFFLRAYHSLVLRATATPAKLFQRFN